MEAIQKLVGVVNWIIVNYDLIIGGVNSVLLAMIGLALILPGDQPEKALQGAVDFLKKYSRK